MDSRRYAVTIKRGIANHIFLSPELLFFIVFFTVVFAIRYNVGVDYINYLDEYESGYKLEYGKNAFLYKQISLAWYNVGAHPMFYFGTFVLIQITFFLLSFKEERYLYPFFVVFLFCNGEVQDWMNIIRSTTAMCIWLYSIKYIERKQFWKYLFFIIIALGFHKAAILYLVLYPLLSFKDVKKPSIFFQIIVVSVAIVIRNMFHVFADSLVPIVSLAQSAMGGENDIYANYNVATMLEDANREMSGTGIAFIVKFLLDLIIVLHSNKMHDFYHSRRFNIMYILFIIALFFFYCFPAYVISFSRPFRFFFVFRTVMLSYFAYYLWKNKKNAQNRLILFATLGIYLGLFVFAQIVCNENSCLWYQTWLNQ